MQTCEALDFNKEW